MPRQRTLIQKTNVGELAPELRGFIGFEKYASGCRALENMLPLAQGPATRRPGTRFVAEVKDSTKRTALLDFEFNETQAYVIEVGDQYIRFFKDKGRITTGSSIPYEVATPYTQTNLFSSTGAHRLHTTQSADVLFMVHQAYAPYRLTRTAHDAWTHTKEVFIDGPYLDENITATTMTPNSSSAGGLQVTASAITGINAGVGFRSTDVGRLIRYGHRVTPWAGSTGYSVGDIRGGQGVSRVYQAIAAGTSSASGGPTGTTDAIADGTVTWKYIGEGGIWWTYGLITSISSTTVVLATMMRDALSTAATAMWQLGEWNDTDGWPNACGFHGGRLFYGGSPNYPQRFDGSKIGDFPNFKPGVLDDDPLAFTMDSNTVNAIRWFASQRDMLIGTSGGEARVGPSTSTAPLSPLNIDVKFQTKHGAEDVRPVEGANAVLFVERFGRALRELAFTIEADGYRAPDMTVLASHLASQRFIDIHFQAVPWSTVWVLREDGLLCSMTYDRDQGVVAWARHPLGGTDIVEAIAVIPGTDLAGDPTGYDQLWIIAKRTVNGATKRFIEVMEEPFTEDSTQANAWFLDCALQYAGTEVSSLSGLDHLVGETLGVWADGGEHPDVVVAVDGSVTLDGDYSTVTVGKKVAWKVTPMPPDVAANDGTGAGAKRQLNGARILFLRSLGVEFGPDDGTFLPVEFRDALDDMGEAPGLFSGWKDCEFIGTHSRDGEFTLQGDNGAPVTIAAIAPLITVHT